MIIFNLWNFPNESQYISQVKNNFLHPTVTSHEVVELLDTNSLQI